MLGGALAAYYAWHERLWNASTWPDIAWLAIVLIPAVFGLILFVLPLWRAPGLLLVGLAFVALSVILLAADLAPAANFTKLAAAVALGFWFLSLFESVLWVALVALIIPVVDSLSVWAGPTRHIVEDRPDVFTTLSFAFPLPGEEDAAQLGPPDLFFFALFLAATVRFGLRTRLTWLAMALSFGATLALTVAVGALGFPALPFLAVAFLAVNADLLWRRYRARGAALS